MVPFNLSMAKQLVASFDSFGHDEIVHVFYNEDETGHQGEGVYAVQHEQEGSVFLFPEGPLGFVWDEVHNRLDEIASEFEIDPSNIEDARLVKSILSELMDDISENTDGDYTVTINRDMDSEYNVTVNIRDSLESIPESQTFYLIDAVTCSGCERCDSSNSELVVKD